MSDGEVGVNPDRVAQAASALENLRDVLAANVPIIASTLNSYWSGGTGSPVSLAALQQALGRAPADAADMRSRARLAAIAAATSGNVNDTNGIPTVDIPWSGTALDDADAKAEAQALAAAEANKDPAAARAAIAAIQQDIQDHVDATDPDSAAFLQAFYNQAAPQVANLATILHNEDASGRQNENDSFTVLSQADQKILATYGQGLAVADKTGLSPAAVSAIVNTPNPWSAAMLIKYGPSGSAYATSEANPTTGKQDAPSLLAQLTDKVFEDEKNGKLVIPMGDGEPFYAGDLTKYQNAIADYEPFTAMLQADAQNKDASWQVLGGPDGAGIAKLILNEGVVPGAGNIVYGYPFGMNGGKIPVGVTAMQAVGSGAQIPEDVITINNTLPSSVVAQFLNAATSAGRGAGDPNDPINQYKLSAQAAANIIMNTPPGWFDNSGNPQPSFDPAVEQALTNTFMRYLPDIAYSSRNAGPFQIYEPTGNNGKPDGGWQIQIPQNDLSPFLQQLGSTPTNYGYIKGAVAAKAGLALGMQLQGLQQGGTDPYADLTSLYGRLIDENNNLKYTGKQQEDAQNAQLNAEISFGEQFIGDIPVVGKAASTALTWDQQMAALGFPQIPQFSTDNAAKQLAAGQQVYSAAELQAMIPIVQGLAQQGVKVYDKQDGWQSVSQQGTQQGWYQAGKVVPNAAFWQWWGQHDGTWVNDQSAPDPTDSQLDGLYQQWLSWMQLEKDVSNTTGGG
jgi:hypothetical protein